MTNYCTAAEVRSVTNKSGTDHDDLLNDIIIPATSLAIDAFCNRPEGFFVADASATARTYVGSGGTVQWIDPCVEISQVAVKDSPSDTSYSAWAAADWIAARGDPEKPDFNSTPYNLIVVSAVGDYDTFTSGRFSSRRGFRPLDETPSDRGVPTVQVTAKWGYATSVPAQIKLAAVAQSSRWYKRGLSAWQDETATTPFGSLRFKTQILDPDIQFMLRDGRFVMPAVGRRY